MAPPKGTPQHYTDEEDEPGEKQAACTERQNRFSKTGLTSTIYVC